jgi:hypothetical protein
VLEIGMGFDLVRIALSAKRKDERCQFDLVGFGCGLVKGRHPVDVVWVQSIIPR